MKPLLIILMILFGSAAMADEYDYREGYREGYHDARYDIKKPRFVKVVRSKPIYKEVVTYRECRPPARYRHPTTHSHEGALIGGLIGGIIGHNLDTDNKGPATVGGAVAGAIIGSKLATGQERHYERPMCKHIETQLVGYKNIAYWRGEKIVKISDRPLRQIRIHPKRYRNR